MLCVGEGVHFSWCKITFDCDTGQFKSSKVHG